MKIRISFPQIVIESKEIEISEDEFQEVKNNGIPGEANFIWSNLTEQEQDWTNGKKWLEGALDAGYCSIKKLTLSGILLPLFLLSSIVAKSQLSSKDIGSIPINVGRSGTGYMDTVSSVTKWNDGRYEVSGDTMKVLKLLFLRLEESNKRELDLWACVATGVDWLNGVGDYFKTNEHNKAWSKYEAALSKLGYRTKNKKRRK